MKLKLIAQLTTLLLATILISILVFIYTYESKKPDKSHRVYHYKSPTEEKEISNGKRRYYEHLIEE